MDSELGAQNDHVKPSEEPLVLLPLEVMVKPLDLRFQYHFSGDRPTNKLDKVASLTNWFPVFSPLTDISQNTSCRISRVSSATTTNSSPLISNPSFGIASRTPIFP